MLFRVACVAVVLSVVGGFAPRALAQAAPGDRADRLLEGITQAVVMPVEFGSNTANRECGVTEERVLASVIGPVVGNGLRTELYAVAQPFSVATPGVYLMTTVATLREGPYMCISWVGLRAQSSQPITVPSTGLFKNAQVLHWSRGLLISTSRDAHAQAVAEAIERLASEFGQQWRAEQR